VARDDPAFLGAGRVWVAAKRGQRHDPACPAVGAQCAVRVVGTVLLRNL
jgi:hypothetical protein